VAVYHSFDVTTGMPIDAASASTHSVNTTIPGVRHHCDISQRHTAEGADRLAHTSCGAVFGVAAAAAAAAAIAVIIVILLLLFPQL
jgi:hypothetical protein